MRTIFTFLLIVTSAYATNIALTDTNIATFGGAVCATGCAVGTSSFTASGSNYEATGQSGEIRFSVNIATNTLQIKACSDTTPSPQAISVSIDGGTPASVALAYCTGSITPVLATISSSLSPGTHKIQLWVIQYDTFIAGSSAFVTDGTGTIADAAIGTLYGVQATTGTIATYGQILGNPYEAASSGYSVSWPFAYYSGLTNPATEIGVQYYSSGATAQTILAYTGGAIEGFSLYVDGVYNSTVQTIPNTQVVQDLTVSGLDSGTHLYEWAADYISTASGIIYVMTGNGGTITPVVVAKKNCVGVYGDSITMYINSIAGTSMRNNWSTAARSTGQCLARYGQGGTIIGPGGTATSFVLRDNTASITGGAFGKPNPIVMEGGVNDQQQLGLCLTCNAGGFATAYQQMLTDAAAAMPTNGKLIALEILPNLANSSTARNGYNAPNFVTTGTASSSSTALTVASGSGVNIGMGVSGTGIAANTYVSSGSMTSWTLSVATTGIVSGTLTFYGGIQAAVAAYNASPSNGVSACVLVTDGLYSPVPPYTASDNLHPSAGATPTSMNPFGIGSSGYGLIDNLVSFAEAPTGIQGSSFTLTRTGSGPGVIGSPITYTIAPAVSGAVFPSLTQTWTVTPIATGSTGTFSPSTVSLSGGATSATFTFTPSATGGVSISLGNLPGCTVSPLSSLQVGPIYGFLLGAI